MAKLDQVRDTAIIHAPLDRVWKLSTRVELVKETLGMNLVSMPASGDIVMGSRVVWSGWKFGLPTEHHTLITGFDPPHDIAAGAGGAAQRAAWFQDSQESGRFKVFQHNHGFRELPDATGGAVTLLGDHVQFSLPLWIGGAVSSRLLLTPYIADLVRRRFAILKHVAESDEWRRWLEA